MGRTLLRLLPLQGLHVHCALSHEEVIASMECNLSKIIAQIETNAKQRSLFLKAWHTTFWRTNLIFAAWKNVILIRHPKSWLPLSQKVIPNPTLQDIGIKKASDLFHYLETHNKAPLVIDSDELMKDPENYLRLVCRGHSNSLTIACCTGKRHFARFGVWAKTLVSERTPNHRISASTG